MSAKAEGRHVLAVGTTSLRTLESAWEEGEGLRAGRGSTRIFIYPGYGFKAVDLSSPISTRRGRLCSCSYRPSPGARRYSAAYDEAVRGRYRFFSYGDAMLIK